MPETERDIGRPGPPDGQDLADDILRSLRRQFPVCMASDEFHYFPQAVPGPADRQRWDDFSPSRMTEITGRLERWRALLDVRLPGEILTPEAVDRSMLRQVIGTLHEQLADVRVYEEQPTFYLTIAGIGLGEALTAGPEAWEARVRHLPAFIDQGIRNLTDIPRLFRDLGLAMLTSQRRWLGALPVPEPLVRPLGEAYDRLQGHLETVAVRDDFRLPGTLYERIARNHMGCNLPADAIVAQLEGEIAETRAILAQSAADLDGGRPWQAILAGLPRPPLPKGGVHALYQAVIGDLGRHCTAQGLMDADLLEACPVAVREIPAYMRPVRSNAAFSMPPGHPPGGGTFFVQEAGQGAAVPVDYRLLAAHETLPGHHLLDTCRWRHARPVRRHIEFPIFYEGWASFAEELLFETGFFAGTRDRLLMAKRRFWRAMRGSVDFNIHTRRQTLEEAAGLLVSHGMPAQRARAMVRRYSLKPGYQLAYTIGRCRFRDLWERFRRKQPDPAAFAGSILAQGEIGFDHLEQILAQGGSP